jgi:glycosyltransferase involved in cell wall biosynthesis
MSPSSDEQDSSVRQRRGLSASNRSLRVGIFTESFPPTVNGVSTSVCALVEQLEALGHKVVVFAPQFPGYVDDRPNVFRCPAVITPYEKQYPLPLPVSQEFLKRVRAANLDIIHSQSPFILGLIAMALARQHNLPLVATNHTLYIEYTHYVPYLPQPMLKLWAKQHVRWYYQRVDAIITPSQMAAHRLTEGYGITKPRMLVVPSGIPLVSEANDLLRDGVRSQYGVLPDEPLLLFVGRLAREKNLMMLLNAFEKHIVPKCPKAKLMLVGSGPDRDAVEGKVAESDAIRDRVILTGFLNRARIDPIYAASDLFVFPSFTETQGMVVGEALATGTPAVVVNGGGSPESIRDGVDGLLTPNDAAEFAKAVVSLLEDPERLHAMGVAGRAASFEKTPEKMTEKIVDLYRTLLAEGPTAFRRRPVRQVAMRLRGDS